MVHATYEDVDLVLQLIASFESAEHLPNRSEVIEQLISQVKQDMLRFDYTQEQRKQRWDRAIQTFHSKRQHISSQSKLEEMKKAIAEAEKTVKDHDSSRERTPITKAEIYRQAIEKAADQVDRIAGRKRKVDGVNASGGIQV